jgi:glycosyltransferase involved in cell wall biosynthesis
MTLRLLLLSPYDAISHQYWRQQLVTDLQTFVALDLTEVTLPARHFSWRFRGNSLTLSQDPQLQAEYDLIIATSMTDFATLKGLAPQLNEVPAIMYFHENQFAYPDHHPERQLERQITSIYSAMAADRLVFNSQFNQQSFLQGAAELLGKMPDGVPEDVVTKLADVSEVIPVPIQKPARVPDARATDIGRDGLQIVWNHRWEHDKGLDELETLVTQLVASGLTFRFHLIGQQFRQIPAPIERIKAVLGSRLGQFGYIKDREAYLALLARCDVVLSTARHEFQGLAVLEAVAAGCRPVVPDDLAYREFLPKSCRYEDIAGAVALLQDASHEAIPLPKEVTAEHVKDRWQWLIRRVCDSLP